MNDLSHVAYGNCWILHHFLQQCSSSFLSQVLKTAINRCAFFSRGLLPAECNYEIYDKELLAIIKCFEEWRPELQSAIAPVKVLTDHRSLEYFMTTKKLNRWQARWAEFLADFSFIITYQAGKIHTKADALTRKPGDCPENGEDDREKHQHQTLLPANKLDAIVKRDLLLHEMTPKPELTDPDISDDKVFVPEDKRLAILKEIHDQPATGHPGIKKTLQLMQHFFYWPKMRATVDQYVRNCHICKRAKSPRDGYAGLLQPLPISERPWTDISLDFVTGLPDSKGFDTILMIVDRFSKMHHYIPCIAKEEGTTAEETAKLLIQNVWKLHGLPTTMVSDRGPQFVSLVWESLCKILQIKAKLSTAFHPQSDGQSERSNQDMETYLRKYVDYLQDDWAEWLPMAEYSSNALPSNSTGLSPFLANYGFEPRLSFQPLMETEGSARERILIKKARDIGDEMKKVWNFAKDNLIIAQEAQKRFADMHRTEASAYKVGDKVWLSTRNVKTERPSRKLDHKMIGPFEIKKVLGQSCQLELPQSMKIHDTFHTSLLRPDPDDPLEGQVQPPPPPVIIDDEDEYEVDDILNSKMHRQKLQYKVRWKGHPPDNTWYPARNFEHSQEIVKDFHDRHPNKPSQI